MGGGLYELETRIYSKLVFGNIEQYPIDLMILGSVANKLFLSKSEFKRCLKTAC